MTLVAREPMAMRTAVLQLRAKPLRWLVTGSAGFIGSHLLEALLRLGQEVVSVDNFETGHRHNLDEVRQAVGDEQWGRHEFLEADIVDPDACRRLSPWTSFCIRRTRLGRARSTIRCHACSQRDGLPEYARRSKRRRQPFVCGVRLTYGDSQELPGRERIGQPYTLRGQNANGSTLKCSVGAMAQLRLDCVTQRLRCTAGPQGATPQSSRAGRKRCWPATDRHLRRWCDDSRLLLRRQCGAGQSAGCDQPRSGSPGPGVQHRGGRQNAVQRTVYDAAYPGAGAAPGPRRSGARLRGIPGRGHPPFAGRYRQGAPPAGLRSYLRRGLRLARSPAVVRSAAAPASCWSNRGDAACR